MDSDHDSDSDSDSDVIVILDSDDERMVDEQDLANEPPIISIQPSVPIPPSQRDNSVSPSAETPVSSLDNKSSSPTLPEGPASTSQTEESPKEEQRLPKKRSHEEADDGNTCPMCLDNWNTSEHRMCSLKCGHSFGENCLTQWLSNQKNCPTCNKKASKDEIIYSDATKLAVPEATELDEVKEQNDNPA